MDVLSELVIDLLGCNGGRNSPTHFSLPPKPDIEHSVVQAPRFGPPDQRSKVGEAVACADCIEHGGGEL